MTDQHAIHQHAEPQPESAAAHAPNGHDTAEPDSLKPQEFWDQLYLEADRRWSGNANRLLVENVDGLTPGTALELGCGEGADAVWLAGQGWRVTAVDVSPVALARAAAYAAEAGVGDRIDWQAHDLKQTFPSGTFDLVCAQYLHSRQDRPAEREPILRAAAAAVAPGGTLLIIGHAAVPASAGHHDAELPSTEQTLRALDLDPALWRSPGTCWRINNGQVPTVKSCTTPTMCSGSAVSSERSIADRVGGERRGTRCRPAVADDRLSCRRLRAPDAQPAADPTRTARHRRR
ncbi:class I SAM-dependent methyltransferase [Nakamurella lactea]|uniref:class I SAM-dependent methyltransferase n=1 Tax=Nakamurella lactea TaxID=459515 RepID=UPI0012B5C471|nr:class I SAM-dependent methyltransferase [Nakamurella lactea]